MLVSSLGNSRQNGLLAAEGAQGPAWKPLRGIGEGLEVTGRVGWEKLWKLNMLSIFRWDIKGGKGALVEKLLLKRLNVLVSEMGSEPEGRSCGFGLERLEHVQNKQTELTWDVEFVTEGSSSCWNTAVMFSSRLWRAWSQWTSPEHRSCQEGSGSLWAESCLNTASTGEESEELGRYKSRVISPNEDHILIEGIGSF